MSDEIEIVPSPRTGGGEVIAGERDEDVIASLVRQMVKVAVDRYMQYGRRGILDPDYDRTRFLNPRFQESCLLLALAGTQREYVPEGSRSTGLLSAAIRVADVWLRAQRRNGAVRVTPNSADDPQGTAYGLYAVSRTLQLASNQVPSTMRSRALKGLKRAVRYLQHTAIPQGPETRPIRAAAIWEAGRYLESGTFISLARTIKHDADRVMMTQLSRTLLPNDAGAYAVALSYLTLMTPEPVESDLELWRIIVQRSRLSTTPSGIIGGGAEVSVACLPLLTGFGLAARHIPEAGKLARLLERAWMRRWYSALLDPDVPWLTPMGYLMFDYRREVPFVPPDVETISMSDERLLADNGSGIWKIGDWLLRLAPGGSLGWAHHIPSESTRIFGSPVGSALREGAWLLEGTRMRHPALTGRYSVQEGETLVIEGELLSSSIPGVQNAPRRIGLPMLRSRYAQDVIRLTPPAQNFAMRMNNPLPYRREIALKEGALTIGTSIPGCITHRVPMIWIGGQHGQFFIGKVSAKMGNMIQERRVRELTFRGDLWPDWVVRFDRPVDIFYEPVNVAISSSPMRYLSAFCGILDIMTSDRLHMAWRVQE